MTFITTSQLVSLLEKQFERMANYFNEKDLLINILEIEKKQQCEDEN